VGTTARFSRNAQAFFVDTISASLAEPFLEENSNGREFLRGADSACAEFTGAYGRIHRRPKQTIKTTKEN
jgi:hypothetical protein